MHTYQYEPLPKDSIRLARILPQSTPHEVRISLQVADLNENLVYDALSYTWGRPCTIFPTAVERDAGPDPPVAIICNGKQLLVSKNLHDYLQVWLRMAQISWEGIDERVQLAQQTGLHAPRALWIDAICINQNDVMEKNHQVSIMGRIYSQSQRVIVWLGPEDFFTRPALTLLFKLSSVPSSRASSLRHLRDDDKCNSMNVPPITSSVWWSVFAFLNRAWFTRAWVVQELALAPSLHVQCGMMSFNWPALAQACRNLRETRLDEALDAMSLLEMEGPRFLEPHFYEDMMPILRVEDRPDPDRHLFGLRKGRANNSSSFVVTLEQIRLCCAIHLRPDFPTLLRDPEFLKQGNGVPMFELLDDARETNCFDPKDKIYAFLEIAKKPYYQAESPSRLRRGLVADYRLPIAEVYLQAAWYLLLSGRALDLLSIAYTFPKQQSNRIPELASWVPDWSSRRAHVPMSGLHAFRNHKWCAAGYTSWDPPDEDKLYRPYLPVQGSLVDTICAVAEDPDNFAVSKAGIVAAKLPEIYPWVTPLQRSGEAFWRTLIADSTETEHPALDFNVLFYNDIWLHEMKRAAREQFESLEKEKEWYRFVHGHSRLFGAVADILKRTRSDAVEAGPLSKTEEISDVESAQDDVPPETTSAITHLMSTTVSRTPAPKSQLDISIDLMVRNAGFTVSGDGQLEVLDEVVNETKNSISNSTGTEQVETTEQTQDGEAKSKSSGDKNESSLPDANEPDSLKHELRRLMNRFTGGRRIFRTDKSYLGNALKTTEAGDQVWLLSGAKVPIVLRPLENGRYRLVGDAYVHGLMHGEAWFGRDLRLHEVELE